MKSVHPRYRRPREFASHARVVLVLAFAFATGQACLEQDAATSNGSSNTGIAGASVSGSVSSTTAGGFASASVTGAGGMTTTNTTTLGGPGGLGGGGGLSSSGQLPVTSGAAQTDGGISQALVRTDCQPGSPCAGYTLIGSPENDGGTNYTGFLIDMQGNVVHRWSITGFPPKMLPGGSLIGCTGVFPTSYDCVEMQQRTWDDQLEWSFSNWVPMGTGTASRHHHDLQREGNPVGYYAPGQHFVDQGKTLVLAHLRKTVPEIRAEALDDDVIYEVDWSGQRTAFEWHGSDHVHEFGFDADALADIATRGVGVLEWLHGNSISLVGPNRLFDAGHTAFHPNNIIYSSRQAAFVAIISRQTGEVVWRIGPDFAGKPEAALGQFAGQHNPHVIPLGLPGAGNMLVFDNGGTSGYGGPENTDRYARSWSRVIEFDPVSFEVVWQYGSADGADRFFTQLLSNAQRLPNGNTLITIGVTGTSGRLIEVTPDKQVVWEFDNPSDAIGQAGWVYRSYRIPPEWLPLGVNEAHGNYASWASQYGP